MCEPRTASPLAILGSPPPSGLFTGDDGSHAGATIFGASVGGWCGYGENGQARLAGRLGAKSRGGVARDVGLGVGEKSFRKGALVPQTLPFHGNVSVREVGKG